MTDLMVFFDRSYFQLMATAPELASELGLSEIGGRRLPAGGYSDMSLEGTQDRGRMMRQILEELRAFPTAGMTPLERESRDIYAYFLEFGKLGPLYGTAAHGLEDCDAVLSHLGGVAVDSLRCLEEWQPIESGEQAEEFLARLAAIPERIDALIVELRRRAADGNIVPRAILDRVEPQLRGVVSQSADSSRVYRRFRRGVEGLDLPASASGRLCAAAETIIERRLRPAYGRLAAYLADEYPRDEARIGLWRLEGGEVFYRFLLRAMTTTELEPDAVHARGHEELERLQGLMSAELDALGYGGADFLERMAAFQADPSFVLNRGDDVLQMARDLVAGATAAAPSVLGLAGIGPCETVAIPEEQAADRHSCYTPPAADGSRPGTMYINTAQMRAGGRNQLKTVCYHEVVPGHHVQLSRAQSLDQLPAFRHSLIFQAYIEGWAKYAEWLTHDAGIDADRHWNLSRMHNELISTVNLIVDTGIHARRWSRGEAIEFFEAQTASARGFAESVIDRIIATPAQTCAYKLGMDEFLAARRRREATLGADFRLADFHAAVLDGGAMPLSLLQARLDAGIAEKRQSPAEELRGRRR